MATSTSAKIKMPTAIIHVCIAGSRYWIRPRVEKTYTWKHAFGFGLDSTAEVIEVETRDGSDSDWPWLTTRSVARALSGLELGSGRYAAGTLVADRHLAPRKLT